MEIRKEKKEKTVEIGILVRTAFEEALEEENEQEGPVYPLSTEGKKTNHHIRRTKTHPKSLIKYFAPQITGLEPSIKLVLATKE